MQGMRKFRASLVALAFISAGGHAMGTEIDAVVENFDQVRVGIAGNIELVASDENRVALEIVKGNPAEFRVAVEDGTLHVSPIPERKRKFWRSIRSARLKANGTIYYKDLTGIVVAGAGNIHAQNVNVKGPNIHLAVNGAGDIDLSTIASGTLKSVVRGSGDIQIREGDFEAMETTILGSGDVLIQDTTALTSQVNIKGSGDYDAKDVKAKSVGVDILGSGDARVFASDNLDISIKGSGNVQHWGESKVSLSVRGSGNVVGR